MKAPSRIIGASFGILAVLSFVVLYSIAAFSDPEYVFGEDYLSDLGVGRAAWAFNSALILSGAFLIAFTLFGMRPILGKALSSRACEALLVLCGMFMIAIGVFTEDYGDLHGLFSYALFLTFLVTLLALAISLHRSQALGRMGVAVTDTAFLVGIVLVFFGATPLVETVSVLVIIAWGTVMSALILLRRVSGTQHH